MESYTRLSLKEREEISRLLACRSSLRAIGRALGRSASSISREVRRDQTSVLCYRAVPAHERFLRQIHRARKLRKLDQYPELRRIVFERLAECWSPEQIAKRLILLYPENMIMRISHETIYAYLYVMPRGALKRQLFGCLRQKREKRKSRNRLKKPTRPIPDLVSIDERPPEILNRTIPGHWEGDLLMGSRNQSALGTLVERTTRFTILVSLRSKDARHVRDAFAREMHLLPQDLKRSLTYDQGQEMAEHRWFTRRTKIKVFFAHPHSPWERGTNENTNGLLRQFFPKGSSFARIPKRKIKHIQDLLNERPRKILNWLTPAEVFQQLLR
jgi:transposase, IS30 family